MHLRLCFTACLLTALLLSAGTPAAQQVDTTALAHAIPGYIEAAAVPGLSVAVVQGGRLFWSGAFGTVNDSAQTPLDDDTVFEAASLSKPVFGYLVLRLVDRGAFDLDRPLYEMLEYPRLAHDERYRRITARLVLNHGTGLPNWGGDPLTLHFDPGTAFGYSGEGFLYLQKVLEHVTGHPLDELARREVFEPLGMTRSSFVWQERFAGNAAYARDWLWNTVPITQSPEANVAGSLLTTATDYAQFVAAVLNGTGLAPETWEAFLSLERESSPGVHFGLGIGVVDGPDGRAFFHGGNNDARFTSYMMGDLETGAGIVFLASSYEGTTLAEALVFHLFGEEVPLGLGRHDDPRQLASLSVRRAAVESGPEAALRRFMETRENPESRLSLDQAFWLGDVLMGLGHNHVNIEVLKTVISDFPDSARAHAALGRAFQREGDLEAATGSFRAALAVDPGHEEAQRSLKWMEEGVAARAQPATVPLATLERYAGQYDVRAVTLRGDTLYYQREGNDEHALIPMAQDLFALSGSQTFRVRFAGDGDGPAAKLIGIYSDGRTDESVRSR